MTAVTVMTSTPYISQSEAKNQKEFYYRLVFNNKQLGDRYD
jgi:hypothetical protein